MLELISSSAGVKSPSMLFVLLLGLKSHPTRCAWMRFRLLVVLSMFAISTIAASLSMFISLIAIFSLLNRIFSCVALSILDRMEKELGMI